MTECSFDDVTPELQGITIPSRTRIYRLQPSADKYDQLENYSQRNTVYDSEQQVLKDTQQNLKGNRLNTSSNKLKSTKSLNLTKLTQLLLQCHCKTAGNV